MAVFVTPSLAFGHFAGPEHGQCILPHFLRLRRRRQFLEQVALLLKIIRDTDYGISRMLRYGYDKNGVEEQSRIPYENMHADVLLLASKNDDCWPADEAVVRIQEKLSSVHYPYTVESHIYEKGCHNMGGNMDIDSKQGKKLQKLMRSWADHPDACRECIEDSK